MFSCDCCLVPGLRNWGDWKVAGLIARRLLVHGKGRPAPPPNGRCAWPEVKTIFGYSGSAAHTELKWGTGGHRFTQNTCGRSSPKHLSWPPINQALGQAALFSGESLGQLWPAGSPVFPMALPQVKLDQGIHVMHLFYSVDRQLWESLLEGASAEAQASCRRSARPTLRVIPHPHLRQRWRQGGFGVFILGEELGMVAQLHRDIEACFPGGALVPVYNYLSVTELASTCRRRRIQSAG